MNSNKITNLSDPIADHDVANVKYVKEKITAIPKAKQYITVWAEESGNITINAMEWSFGNGTENNAKYGWPGLVQ